MANNKTKKPSKTKTHKKGAAVSERKERKIYQWIPFFLIFTALIFEIVLLLPDDTAVIGSFISKLLFGLFSWPAYILPVLMVVIAVYFRRIEGSIIPKVIYSSLCLLMLCAVINSFSDYADNTNIIELYKAGTVKSGGGAIGGFLGAALYNLCGGIITRIVGIACIVIFCCLLFDITPHTIWVWIRFTTKKRYDKIKQAREESPRQKFRFTVSEPVGGARQRKNNIDTLQEDVSEEDISNIIKENEKIINEINAKAKDMPSPEKDGENKENKEEKVNRTGDSATGKIDLDRIFDEEDEPVHTPTLTLERDEIGHTEEEAKKDKKEPKKYILPPLSLLKNPGKRNTSDGRDEAAANAIKLVKTLASFKVNTHISNISRGPTVTRYELVPEEGVRVRSVANLVDDISLSLATEGVRIEAPIPGKSAIGIEVPNKNVNTVYLRELIERDEFKNAKSKLTAALGMDVAGEPRFFDIAKMPHLLIAGATGMGKSVCINSIVMSLLYRATPDEVRLILIDPKKVELNVYNGLPHLLVPVVSHPKKAAGTLNWACIEMERRFELIEDVGVRDIGGYNEMTRNDPEREFLPHIVIIIDELADLMMTAPDDVENSICRLAQKARAAGMHLIIGTQRPSVDVITGLIKANIPSRIAFTVASQIDSRTILDIGGAEKLIGRGDMLFAPVGSTKPIRVQGSFVSDGEVDAVVGFIKRQAGDADYDQSVVESIEKEAERCGTGKKSGGDGDESGEDDPRLFEALEIVVEAGKASTSYLQRRMSVGYGKAAKLIDQMESHGWVGPPDGSKPREVRISKQEFMEMSLNKKDEAE